MTFEIQDIERIGNGSALRATFDLILPGVTLRRCRLIATQRREPFVTGPHSKDTYAIGGWREHATLDVDLAAEVCEAVCARLSAGAVAA